ncbi:hypothetical protein V8E51_018286 [Hyaloscypha variabilis]
MSRIRVESPQPVNLPATTQTQTQLATPLTRTPSKRRRERGLSNAHANPDSTNSAVSKKVTTPRRVPAPCKFTLKQVEDAQKEEWEAEWDAWVVGHLWVKDKNYEHPAGTTTIYRRNAMNSFFVNQSELDTLPYQEFPNRYNCAIPIRSYKREDVRTLACRKHAMLAGLHKQGLALKELLRRGEKLQTQMQLRLSASPPSSPSSSLSTPISPVPISIRPHSVPALPTQIPNPKKALAHVSVSVIEMPLDEAWVPPVWQRAHLSGSPTISDFDPEDLGDMSVRSYQRLEWPMSP